MRRLFIFSSLVCTVILSMGFLMLSGGCAGPINTDDKRCAQDYNCADGEICVARQCKKPTPPPKREVPPQDASTPEKEPPKEAPPKEEAPKPDKPGPTNTCTSSADCTNARPNCHEGKCVAGYFEFSFNSGIFITNTTAPNNTCSSALNCQAGQTCAQTSRSSPTKYCIPMRRTGYKGQGKLLQNSFFFDSFTYGEIAKAPNGAKVLRIILIGSLSYKLEKRMIVDVPLSFVKREKIKIDGKLVRARFDDVKIEFSPPRISTFAVGVSGFVNFTEANTQLGQRISGDIKIILDKY